MKMTFTNMRPPRAYSITTRIETRVLYNQIKEDTCLREHIPLQQGLRPMSPPRNTDFPLCAPRAYSITTRIETIIISAKRFNALLREHIPLQQGLRLALFGLSQTEKYILREHIPLQQGLRPFSSQCMRSIRLLREHIPLQQGLRLR